MFYVGKFDESAFTVPPAFAQNSRGYERANLIDHKVGSVHMGASICQLQPAGTVACCIQANEKGIYVLEGELEIKRGNECFRLSADDYVLIPYGTSHALRNTGNKAARWFEMQAPQPNRREDGRTRFLSTTTNGPRKLTHRTSLMPARNVWAVSRRKNRSRLMQREPADSPFFGSCIGNSARSSFS